jgi:hypothetical protein
MADKLKVYYGHCRNRMDNYELNHKNIEWNNPKYDDHLKWICGFRKCN